MPLAEYTAGEGDWVGCRKACQAEVAKTGMKRMFCSQNQVGEHREDFAVRALT